MREGEDSVRRMINMRVIHRHFDIWKEEYAIKQREHEEKFLSQNKVYCIHLEIVSIDIFAKRLLSCVSCYS